MAKHKTKTAIYHPPKSGMPYLVVTISTGGVDVTAVSSKEEARILPSNKTLTVLVRDDAGEIVTNADSGGLRPGAFFAIIVWSSRNPNP
jgi:hypothetical protein